MLRGIIFALLLMSPSAWATDHSEVRSISLVALLAAPSAFDGKVIAVQGYVCGNRQDGYGIFLSESDCRHWNGGNGLRLALASSGKNLPRGVNVLTVEGRFIDTSQLIMTGELLHFGRIEVSNFWGRSAP